MNHPKDLERSIEVAAFQHHHGLSESDACDLVGIEQRDLINHNTSAARLQYLPTPAEIKAIKLQIQSGEIVIGKCGHQWGLIQDARAVSVSVSSHDDDGDDGSFPAVMPIWFRG